MEPTAPCVVRRRGSSLTGLDSRGPKEYDTRSALQSLGTRNWHRGPPRNAPDGGLSARAQGGIGPIRTGVFNVADMAIMLGAAIVVFVGFGHKSKESSPVPEGDDTA